MFAMFRQPLDVLLSPLLLASLFLGLSLADRTVSDGVPGPSSSTELRPFPRSGIGSSFSYKATEPIPLSQNILYIVGTFLVVGGLVLRFLSYRGDSSDEPRRSRRIGDAAIVIAVVTYLTVSALQFFLLTEEHALADHIDPVYGAHFGMTVDMRVRKGQILYSSRVLYAVVVYATKVPYLAHYSSVRHVSNPRYNHLLRVLGVATAIGFCVALSTSMFTCGRPSNSWALGRYEMCNPFLNMWMLMANAILNLSTQTLILLYPLQATVGMRSSSILLRIKTLVIFFLFGMWPLVTGYARVFTILFYIDVNTGAPLTSPSSLTAIATHCDMAALIVTASIPQYRVLWRKLTADEGGLTRCWLWGFSPKRTWRRALHCGKAPLRPIHPPWDPSREWRRARPGAFNLDMESFQFNYPAGVDGNEGRRSSAQDVASAASATGSSRAAAPIAPRASRAAHRKSSEYELSALRLRSEASEN